MLFKYTIFLIHLLFYNGLMPKRLPNGKIVKFKSNYKHPESDLKVITPGTASIISRNWLQNILAEVVSKENLNFKNNVFKKDEFKKDGLFDYDDLHIVMGINKLENYIQESYQSHGDNINKEKKLLFLAWSPNGEHGKTEVLFIIVAQIHVLRREFIISHLIQSPFWDPSQIDSTELKNALIAQNILNNCTQINLEYLYDNNLRYKLAWAVWGLNATKPE